MTQRQPAIKKNYGRLSGIFFSLLYPVSDLSDDSQYKLASAPCILWKNI